MVGVIRTRDAEIIETATEGFQGETFQPQGWVDNEENIALLKGGDLNLFQHQGSGVYQGHFFYRSRGKEAVAVANEMLPVIFEYPEVAVIVGLTPVTNLGAKWLTRKLGFTSYGVIETNDGRHEFFVLTRADYERNKI